MVTDYSYQVIRGYRAWMVWNKSEKKEVEKITQKSSTVPPPLSHTIIYLPLVCTEIIILLHVYLTPLDNILLWVWEVPGYSVIPENYIKTVAVVLLISTQHIGTFSRIKSGQKKGVDNIWNRNPSKSEVISSCDKDEKKNDNKEPTQFAWLSKFSWKQETPLHSALQHLQI